MNTKTRIALAVLALAAFGASTSALAQLPASIARVQMTDNDLSCQAMFDEIKLMDTYINGTATATAAAPAASSVGGQVAGQVAGAVAQQAMGQVAGRLGGMFGGGASLFGGGGGGGGLFGGGGNTGGGLLGSVVGQVAQTAVAQQQQNAAQAQAQQQAALANLAPQAAVRKEHLTGLFLGKPCKMSDVKQ